MGPITWRKLYEVYWGIQNNAPAPTPVPPPVSPPGMPPYPGAALRLGSTGENVRMIQRAINRLSSVFPELWRIPEDGIFGEETRDAIFTFQRITGLNIDGVVGPITWDRLFREYLDVQPGGNLHPPPPPVQIPPYPGFLIRQGATGANVRLIQNAINRLWPCHPGRLWRLNEDGIFGPITRDAVMTVQSIFGLNVDGIVGPITWDRLFREAAACEASQGGGGGGVTPPPQPPAIPPYPGSPIRLGATGEDVRLIQQAINRLAPSYPGRLWIIPVDGIFSTQTRDAIFTFQSIFGLNIDGVVGPNTWDRLMRESANVQAMAVESSEHASVRAQQTEVAATSAQPNSSLHLGQLVGILLFSKL